LILNFFLKAKHLTENQQQAIFKKYQQLATDFRNKRSPKWDVKLEGIEEFILYLKGVRELELDGKHYPKSWFKLLALPEESRQYRSTWVYYMTANFTNSDEDRVNCYQKVRDLNKAGYHDSLGLAHASYLSEFKYTQDVIIKTQACVKALYYYNSAQDLHKREYIQGCYS